MQTPLLKMENISKQFNGVAVLEDAYLEVNRSEAHVLIGENGAGKSTLMKILSGAYRTEKGQIYLNGEKIAINNPKEAIVKGISIIYQEFTLVPYLSVYENIYLGKEFCKHGLVDHKRAIEESRKWLDLVGLEVDPRAIVETLSVAEQQMVEIAKALALDVTILVLDEPTAALTDKETNKLFQLIERLKSRGLGIIYISHRMEELFRIGDRCTVMRDGRTIKTMALSDTTIDELTYLMVGRKVDLSRNVNPHKTDETLMICKDICWSKPGRPGDFLKNVSFELKRGEILGVAGLVGSGRTELAKCIIGAYTTTNGEVVINGKKLTKHSVRESIANGLVYLSEDRKREGLTQIHSVMENIALPNLHKMGRFMISPSKVNELVDKSISDLKIKVRNAKQEVGTLSGGNQQKVVIARWLPRQAKVYIFDEPTRGIDVGARAEIYGIMQRILETDSSIIMISSDMNELMKMSDRIAVMKDGKLLTLLENNDALTPEEVLSYILLGKGKA